MPDATRAGGGGKDIEQRPAMFCRKHLEELLGHTPEEQPIFRRHSGPAECLRGVLHGEAKRDMALRDRAWQNWQAGEEQYS